MAKKRSPQAARSRKGTPPAGKGYPAFGAWDAAGLALVFVLALIVYAPALQGTFIWEDGFHITTPALRQLDGLWRIWTEPGVTQQYNPLLHSAFWIQHRLWGDAPAGYHVTNALLHSIAVFLVVLIVRRLRLPGAWIAGLIFCLHPVCAQSVAWISGLKALLPAVFSLAAGLVYLDFDESRKRPAYGWSTGLFVLALLSNPSAAALPLGLLAVLWWRHGRIGWKKDLAPLLPWLALGLCAVLAAAWIDRTYAAAHMAAFGLSLPERFLLAGRIAWFYLAKLVWPPDLAFNYPRFGIDAAAWWQYAFPVGLLALLGLAWLWRKKHRGPLAGLLFFLASLLPVLGFFNVFAFRHSFVADQAQYLACLGILVPIACGLMLAAGARAATGPETGFRLLRNGKPAPEALVCGILLLVLAVLTWKQSGMYAGEEQLWRTTIARNPSSSLAYTAMGEIMFRRERPDEALEFCRKAVALAPGDAEANANLGNVLRYKGQFPEAAKFYQNAADLKPNVASFHGSLGTTLIEMGRIREAVARYERALRLDPSDGMLANNLAWTLATCPDASIRNGERALEVASRAVGLLGDRDPTVTGTLAAAQAELGRFDEAIRTAEKAYALAQTAGDPELVQWHAYLLGTYQTRQPHRESSLRPR